jgi:hypothetical protein
MKILHARGSFFIHPPFSHPKIITLLEVLKGFGTCKQYLFIYLFVYPKKTQVHRLPPRVMGMFIHESLHELSNLVHQEVSHCIKKKIPGWSFWVIFLNRYPWCMIFRVAIFLVGGWVCKKKGGGGGGGVIKKVN